MGTESPGQDTPPRRGAASPAGRLAGPFRRPRRPSAPPDAPSDRRQTALDAAPPPLEANQTEARAPCAATTGTRPA